MKATGKRVKAMLKEADRMGIVVPPEVRNSKRLAQLIDATRKDRDKDSEFWSAEMYRRGFIACA